MQNLNQSFSFVSLTQNHFPDPAESARQHAVKRENYYVPYCYSGNLQGTKTVCSGEATDGQTRSSSPLSLLQTAALTPTFGSRS